MTETMRRVNSIIKEYNKEKQGNIVRKELDPKEFTDHVNTAANRGHIPVMQSFTVNAEFITKVQRAITRSPSGKASGTDETVVEAFMIQASETAKILSEFWAKCSELKYMIQAWNTCTIVPVYKKGETHDPTSYRPIAILSHAKKVIEKAIWYQITKHTKFDITQLGFQEKTSTENALLRTTNHFKNNRNFIAVLELKSAYTEVPRDKLLKVASERLTKTWKT